MRRWEGDHPPVRVTSDVTTPTHFQHCPSRTSPRARACSSPLSTHTSSVLASIYTPPRLKNSLHLRLPIILKSSSINKDVTITLSHEEKATTASPRLCITQKQGLLPWPVSAGKDKGACDLSSAYPSLPVQTSFFLAVSRGMWDLNSLTRDQTCTLNSGSMES